MPKDPAINDKKAFDAHERYIMAQSKVLKDIYENSKVRLQKKLVNLDCAII